MKPQEMAVWIGIASSIGGVAVGYGSLNEKVTSLEKSSDPTHLEQRLTTLEVRSEDADLGHISKEIESIRGSVKNLSTQVTSISIPDTAKINSRISVLETKVENIGERLQSLGKKLDSIKDSNKSPL
tara:strand:+ start:797 stop:1177 length:381 start_codon:yes stop_codon:yes gene_type:complete